MSTPLSKCAHCGQGYLDAGAGHGCPESHLAAQQTLRRSERKHQTPEDADAARKKLRMQEAAERERGFAERLQIAAEASARLLGQPPVEDEHRSALDNIAYNVHNAYHWDGRGDQCVTAVVLTKSGQYVVFPQRRMTVMQTYAQEHYKGLNLQFMVRGEEHLHAEMYAVLHYLSQQQHPGEMIQEIGVSKPICPLCQHVLNYLGIAYNTRWVTDSVNGNWVDPWKLLACEPVVKSWQKKDKDPEEKKDKGL